MIIDKNISKSHHPAALDYLEGQVLLMHKPYGWTSFQLVKKVKYILSRHHGVKKIKVGHAGTLDPLASGLMILCTGRKTKSIDDYQGMDKTYTGTMKLGATTPSYDRETEEDATYPTGHITTKSLKSTMQSFTGELKQYPPAYSAKKINGQRAYQKAHKGQEVATRPAIVSIHKLKLLDYDEPFAHFEVYCSKGTYIRTLVHDVGKAQHSGAYLTALTRTAIGPYLLQNALQPDTFQQFFQES